VKNLCLCYINQRHYLLVCQKVKKKKNQVRGKYIRELQHRVSAHKEEFASTIMEAIRRSLRKSI
jgi:hypothetical protein